MNDLNIRLKPDGEEEDEFRDNVRFALGMDVFSRDDQIIAEIERLKRAVRFVQPVEAIKFQLNIDGQRLAETVVKVDEKK